MFFGKRQAYAAQMPMQAPMAMQTPMAMQNPMAMQAPMAMPTQMPMQAPMMGMAGPAGMPGMEGMPEVSGYAHPSMYGEAGVGYEGMAPGMAESVRATTTEYDMPGCPPVHFGHTEIEMEREPYYQAQVHIVRKGETVYKIARRYGLDWRELAGYNHLGNPNLIYPGERLMIPRW
ncbi:spore coat assembly protein ExsA [Peptococcaceae bacterium CEB3]|nr:spore coat assembly protein ExsA [Peptococcaceae bacterium CEB3]